MTIRETLCCAKKDHIAIQWVGVLPCPLCASHAKIAADRRIIEAAREVVAETPCAWQDHTGYTWTCIDCEAYAEFPDRIQHSRTCRMQELRRAIEAADRGKETSE